jgi:hypothetical protein
MDEQITSRRKPQQPLVTLLDGAASLWDMINDHAPDDTTKILDILHVAQYVWKAANVLCASSEELPAFVRPRLLRILKGRARSVVRGLRKMATARKMKGANKAQLSTVCNYLSKHFKHMQYDRYLKRGFPIASGVIEGACRHLVKDRMERSGMRWILKGAKAMLNVRAVHQSAYWELFHRTRRDNEQQSIHPHRSLLKDYQPSQIAV